MVSNDIKNTEDTDASVLRKTAMPCSDRKNHSALAAASTSVVNNKTSAVGVAIAVTTGGKNSGKRPKVSVAARTVGRTTFFTKVISMEPDFKCQK